MQTGKPLNTQSFTYLLANPQKISGAHTKELHQVIESYPYFQTARALQLKGLKQENSFLYNDALKVTAAYTTDRNVLFEYITSEKFVQHEISQAILGHESEAETLEVKSEDLTEQVSLELDKQIKAELKKAEAILNPKLFERKVAAIQSSIEETETKEQPSATDTLEIDAPLPFTKKDTHSFSEWLKLSKATPIDRSETEEAASEATDQATKERKFELIDKFIQERPRILPKESSEKNTDLAAPYTEASDSLMTETLAKVYVQQKNYKKAIQAYKILILKNPEKSGFFADRIRAITKLINTEQ